MGRAPGSRPLTIRGSPPAEGYKYPFWSGPIPTTNWPSGEVESANAETPSGEIAFGVPPEAAVTSSSSDQSVHFGLGLFTKEINLQLIHQPGRSRTVAEIDHISVFLQLSKDKKALIIFAAVSYAFFELS